MNKQQKKWLPLYTVRVCFALLSVSFLALTAVGVGDMTGLLDTPWVSWINVFLLLIFVVMDTRWAARYDPKNNRVSVPVPTVLLIFLAVLAVLGIYEEWLRLFADITVFLSFFLFFACLLLFISSLKVTPDDIRR